jgi:hypothetical protein
MKHLLFILLLSSFTLSLKAQQPNMADVQAQMQRAQHLIDSAKKAHPEMQQALDKAKSMQPGTQHTLDSAKRSNPNSTGMSMPDSSQLGNMTSLPDLNKISQNMQEGMTRVKGAQSGASAQKAQLSTGLPQSGPNRHFTALPNADSLLITGIIQTILPQATEKLKWIDPLMQKALDALIEDSTITPQAQGILMLSEKYPKYMAQYMICKGVLQNPRNPWAINDLGILLRNEHRNKEAAQCFKYAYRFNDSFLVIKCNLAWAVAYYGDFTQAKQYFHEILNRLPDYSSAWEGLGMMAYQEGDTKTLFECLAHQVTSIGGGGGGPSDNFTGFCQSVKEQEMVADPTRQKNSNPMDDHTFDNGDDNSPGAEYDATGYTEAPHYPSFSGIFAQSIDDLSSLLGKMPGFRNSLMQMDEKNRNYMLAKEKEVSRLDLPSFQDNTGVVVTPKKYDKYWWLYNSVAVEFDERISWLTAQFGAEWDKLSRSILAQQMQNNQEYGRELGSVRCPPGSGSCCPACTAMKCKWKPIFIGQLKSDLGGISSLWTKYFKEMQQQIAWYVNASNPFIRRMVRPDWNELMNVTREYDVRHTILVFYLKWLEMQSIIGTKQPIDAMFGDLTCTTELRTMGDQGPDIKTTKIKKLKTFPDYCDRKDPENSASFSFGPINYQSDCDHTKLAFNIIHLESGGKIGHSEKFDGIKAGASAGLSANADLGMVFEHVRSKKFKEDDYYDLGTSISLGIEASAKAGLDGEKGWVSSSSSAGLKASASVYSETGWRFSPDGDLMGRYQDLDINAGVKASTKSDSKLDLPVVGGQDLFDTKKAFGGSVEVKREVFAQVGSDGNYNNYQTSLFQVSQGH